MRSVRATARELLPPSLRSIARRVVWYGRAARNLGRARYCPVCQSHMRAFLPFGVVPRPDACCPVCGALERHRLLWLYFRRKTALLSGRPIRMLHIAPEPAFTALFSRLRNMRCVTGDLHESAVTVRMDIARLPFADDSFDTIYCSHVLNYVPDDRRAMREFRRVLKGDGWAVLQVPIERDVTFEDWSVQTPEDRERVFGLPGHVRIYGEDFLDRLREAGLDVRVDRFRDEFSSEDRRRMGLGDARGEGDVYLCHKFPGAGRS